MILFINGYLIGVVSSAAAVLYLDYLRFRARQKADDIFKDHIKNIFAAAIPSQRGSAQVLQLVKKDEDKNERGS